MNLKSGKLTVGGKLAVGFGILIILVVVLSIFSTMSLGTVNDDLGTLYNMHLVGVENIKDTEVSLISLGRARNNLILAQTRAEEDRHIESIYNLFEKFEENMKFFDETVILDESNQILDDVDRLWQELKADEEKAIEMVKRNAESEAFDQAMKNREIADEIEAYINELVILKNEQALDAYNRSNATFDRTISLSIILVVLSIVIGVVVTLYMTRIIAKPIVKMADAAKEIADGNLSIDTIIVKNRDEIGDLANSFNRMVDELRNVIKNTLEASQQVAASSQELSAASEETTSATEEIASTINQLAIGASKQALEATDINMVVSQIAISIQNVAENGNKVSEASQNVSDKANNGLEEAKKAIEKIERIKQVTAESSGVVKILGDESNKIGEIVEVIKGISDQTNLLALNAAIEAARAGEEGKGFAVVAEEVRKLAEQSAISTLEIGKIINGIQVDTKRVVDVMDIATAEVEEGVIAVNETGKYFGMIVNDINEITSEIEQVSAAVQEVASGTESANEAIEDIASIAEENAASSEEVSAASEEQSAIMVQVAESAQGLAKLSEELQLNVSIFRL